MCGYGLMQKSIITCEIATLVQLGIQTKADVAIKPTTNGPSKATLNLPTLFCVLPLLSVSDETFKLFLKRVWVNYELDTVQLVTLSVLT